MNHLSEWRECISAELSKVLGSREFATALDVGVGESNVLVKENVTNLTVVDNYPEAIERIRKSGYNGIIADVANLVGGYDLVVCSEVLEHTNNPFLVAERLKHLTNPGGVLFVTVPVFLGWHQMRPVCDDNWRFMPGSLDKLFDLEPSYKTVFTHEDKMVGQVWVYDNSL